MSFPARLKALLEERKISMRELGRRIGTSHVTVGKWLSGIPVFIKRVQIHPGGKVELISDNPKYRPIQLDTCESVEVIGRAVLCFNVREL